MKKGFMLLVICLSVLCLFGCQPKEAEARDSRPYRDPCETFLGSVLNDCVEHTADKKARVEAGVGFDVPLWKTEKLIVDQETKFDLNSGNGTWTKSNLSTYTVFKPQLDEGIFQTAWRKIKDWYPFKKDVE